MTDRAEIELAPAHTALPSNTEWTTMLSMAEAISRTEFVPKGLRGRADATLAAIMFGREIGLPPMVAMSSVHIIEGHPTMSAHLLTALIRKAGHQITESETTAARAYIKAKRGDTGEQMAVEFTIEEAGAAGLATKDNWKKYPADMLWARCISRLYRRLFSDVAFGATIYVPEDFGVTGDEAADAGEAPVLTEQQAAEVGVMFGIDGFVPRPADGEPMGELVKKELLVHTMKAMGLPPWKQCSDAQHRAAIVETNKILLDAYQRLGIEWVEGARISLTFEQARDVLNLVRDGTLPATEDVAVAEVVTEAEEIAPSPPLEDVVDAEVVPENRAFDAAAWFQRIAEQGEQIAEEKRTRQEQAWAELFHLMEQDITAGVNAQIEYQTRRLYKLMHELGLWADDQMHQDLAPRKHYSDLGKKAEYQKFAADAKEKAKTTALLEREPT